MDTTEIAAVVALEAASLGCVVHLWSRGTGSHLKKAIWTPVLLLPVLGPLAYGGFYVLPEEQPESLQAKENRDA